MIRLILIALELVLFLILFIPVMLVLMVLRRYKKHLASDIAQAIVRRVFHTMLFLAGSKVEVRGSQNIPKENGVLFVSNHKGYFDILAGFGFTYKRLGFVAKVQMRKIPLLKQWMEILNCLFLDRENIKEGLKTILKGIENVKEDISVWICPEGTRVDGEDILAVGEFKEGSLKISEKSGSPIVPVAISGSYEIFERQFPKIRPSTIIIEYGEPIYPNEIDKETKKKLGAYTRERILDMLKTHIEDK